MIDIEPKTNVIALFLWLANDRPKDENRKERQAICDQRNERTFAFPTSWSTWIQVRFRFVLESLLNKPGDRIIMRVGANAFLYSQRSRPERRRSLANRESERPKVEIMKQKVEVDGFIVRID